MSTRKERNRRDRLYRRDPHCHWCGELTLSPDDPAAWTREAGRRKAGPRMATLDHLDSRLSPLRGTFSVNTAERTVLACWECNQQRSVAEQQGLPMDKVWRRAGRYPATAPNPRTHPDSESPENPADPSPRP